MSSDPSHYPDLVQILLKKRGIIDAAEAERFLNPSYERDVADPFGILNMERAVSRILAAIDSNERIVVYADYDCDGIPGATLFNDFLKKIGYENFEVYIPHRNNEGYGMSVDAVEALASRGAKLIITIDCGIVDVEPVARANELGIDVIITDHHLPQETLPPAYAIINSKQEGDTYHDNMLCGAATAWKLVCALLAKRGEEWGVPNGWEKWLLDMAGLSTIADLVPLQKENRALAHYGLTVLRKSKRPGLLALLAKMDMVQKNITEDDIGFMIGPRINAASRMGDPRDAFLLLSAESREVADEYAEKLMHLNDVRKGLVASMVKEARHHLAVREIPEVIVVGNPLWKPGLVGLVASNLSETYARTVFVWGRGESGEIKGSCRSDGTVNVVDLMTSVSENIFLDVGGHEMAGGFSVSSDGIHTLEEKLIAAYQKVKKEKEEMPVAVDATLTLAQVNWTNWKYIEKFAPFGVANPKPTFLFEGVRIVEVRYFGKEQTHLELSLLPPRSHLDAGIQGETLAPAKAIVFFAKESKDEHGKHGVLKSGDVVDLVATIELNTFRNKRELRLRIVSIKQKG